MIHTEYEHRFLDGAGAPVDMTEFEPNVLHEFNVTKVEVSSYMEDGTLYITFIYYVSFKAGA
jgi:hypothetical protein